MAFSVEWPRNCDQLEFTLAEVKFISHKQAPGTLISPHRHVGAQHRCRLEVVPFAMTTKVAINAV